MAWLSPCVSKKNSVSIVNGDLQCVGGAGGGFFLVAVHWLLRLAWGVSSVVLLLDATAAVAVAVAALLCWLWLLYYTALAPGTGSWPPCSVVVCPLSNEGFASLFLSLFLSSLSFRLFLLSTNN